MRFALACLVFLSAAGAQACALNGTSDIPKLIKCPAEMSSLVKRQIDCQSWSGELREDRSTREDLVKAKLDEFRCHSIEGDEKDLRKKYKKDASVGKTLDAVHRIYLTEGWKQK